MGLPVPWTRGCVWRRMATDGRRFVPFVEHLGTGVKILPHDCVWVVWNKNPGVSVDSEPIHQANYVELLMDLDSQASHLDHSGPCKTTRWASLAESWPNLNGVMKPQEKICDRSWMPGGGSWRQEIGVTMRKRGLMDQWTMFIVWVMTTLGGIITVLSLPVELNCWVAAVVATCHWWFPCLFTAPGTFTAAFQGSCPGMPVKFAAGGREGWGAGLVGFVGLILWDQDQTTSKNLKKLSELSPRPLGFQALPGVYSPLGLCRVRLVAGSRSKSRRGGLGSKAGQQRPSTNALTLITQIGPSEKWI